MAMYFYDATADQLQHAGFPTEWASVISNPFSRVGSNLRETVCSWAGLERYKFTRFEYRYEGFCSSAYIVPVVTSMPKLDWSRLDELFTFKLSINGDLPCTTEVQERVVQKRDHSFGGIFRSWREVRSVKGVGEGKLLAYQEQFSMPISLSKATALQLGLCLTKSKTEWFVQQRETHGSFLLKVARLASQPHSDNDDEPQTGLGPLTVDDCRNLMDIFSAPAMNLNEALYTDLTKMAKMSMAEARKILRSHQVREFTSWVDFSERMPDKLVEELNLDVFFALPNGIKVHQNSGLRKNFGTGLDRVKEEVWKYRGNFDFSSQLSRANINAVFGFTELELEHVIDVQLGELAWQRGPCRIFGEVVCDKEFMGKSIDLFNSVCNLNVTTKDINRRKGQVVKNWKDKDDGPVKNPRLFDRLPYSPSLWRNSEAEMKKSFDHMFDLTFSTVGKAAGFDRSEMLQRWKDPKMKLRKRAQIAFLEELHKVLQEMLGCEF